MTISRKLVLTLLAVAVTPLLVALFTVNKLISQQTEQLVGLRLQDNVEQSARAIDQFMLDSLRNMKAFSDGAQGQKGDSVETSQRLRSLTYSYPTFTELMFTNLEGRVTAASSPELIGQNVRSDHPHLDDEFVAASKDKYGQVYVSDTDDFHTLPSSQKAQHTRELGPPLLMVAAVQDAHGRLLGMLIGRVVIGGVRDLVTDLNHRTPGGLAAILMDKDGTVLVSSAPDLVFPSGTGATVEPLLSALSKGKGGWIRRTNETGAEVITGYSPLWEYGANKAGGWYLMTNASYKVIMAPVATTVNGMIWWFGVLLIGSAFVGLVIARTMSMPLLHLAEAARSISKGDYSVRVKPMFRDETGLLAETFNHMATQVEIDRAAAKYETDERLKAEEASNRFFTLSLDMLGIGSADGEFERTSPAFKRVLGWNEDDLKGHNLMEFVHPDDAQVTGQSLQDVGGGGELADFEHRFRCKDGSYRWLSWKVVPYGDGLVYAAARDVTHSKEAQEALTTAIVVAESANMAKNEFLSHMSHELRTPLNAVIGFAQLLQLQSDDGNTLESAQSILKGGRHLLDLVNEILDLSRIEADRMTVSVEPVPVWAALNQAVELVRPLAREKGVTISVEPEIGGLVHVQADRQRLVQILLNLLNNAVKYNRPDGKVIVRCIEGPPEGLHRLEIQDTGLGIKLDNHHHLFEPFERMGDTSTDGTGLGLALSRRLARMMGGEVQLAKTSEDGSTFTVELLAVEPLVIPSAPDEVVPAAPQWGLGNRMKVVYIEDNVSNVHLLERVLENRGGIDLFPAMQASLGIQLVKDHLPDLVLLDNHLPDGSGLEVLQSLRSNSATQHIPIVIISADATDNQIKALLEAGARSYLTKPIDLVALFAEIDSARDVG